MRGIGRDFAVDQLPAGVVWDLVDYIPSRRGAKLEGRGPWSYLSTTDLGAITGGKHAAFSQGTRLLVVGGSNVHDHPLTPGAPISSQALFPVLHNGVLLRDRVYFAHATGAVTPKFVTFNGTVIAATALAGANTPKPTVIDVYKDRLIGGGDPANNARLFFSPLETAGGPPAAWDVLSYVDTSRRITGLAPMSGQILVFHTKSIEKVRGAIPPGTNIQTDMSVEFFSDQMGCEDPASICNWQENVIFANSRGVHLTDGATIRSLTDQGSMGDFWRNLYAHKRTGQVVCGVYLDWLFVTVLSDFPTTNKPTYAEAKAQFVTYTNWKNATPSYGQIEYEPVTLICDLNERAWHRFHNIYATAYIESESAAEEMWLGLEKDNKLAKASPIYSWDVGVPEEGAPAPATDAIDGNGNFVNPLIDLGFQRLGAEGVKRIRHVYVSHQTMSVDPVVNPEILQVEYEVDVRMERDNFLTAGQLPCATRYKRHRLRLGRRGYGIHLVVKQIAPAYLSRLYDISVEQWPQDQGKL